MDTKLPGIRTLETLSTAMQGNVPQARILCMLSELVDALAPLHAQGRAHGAIHPGSVGLDELGRAYLLLPPDEGAVIDANALMPGYAAFEQYTDDPASPRGPWTDVYALAGLGYLMVTGEHPPAALERCVLDTRRILTGSGLSLYDDEFLAALDRNMSLCHRDRDMPADIAWRANTRMRPSAAASIVVPTATPRAVPSPATDSERVRSAAPRSRWVSKLNPGRFVRTASGSIWLPIGATVFLGAAVAFFGLRGALANGDPTPETAPRSEVWIRSPSMEALRSRENAAPTRLTVARGGAPSLSGGQFPGMEVPLVSVPAVVTKSPPTHRGSKPFAAVASQSSRSSAADNTKCNAWLELNIRPWGAVFVDGHPRGVSPPLRRLCIKPGLHRITLRNSDLPEYSQSLIVEDGRATSIDHQF